jgi:amino acid transporter
MIALIIMSVVNVVEPQWWIEVLHFDFLNAWSYLYWYGYKAPLGIPPFVPLLGEFARPDLAWLFIALAIGTLVPLMITNTCYVWIIGRTFFAWSFDRMAPELLARINPRTRSPVNSIILSCIGALIFLVVTVYVINLASLVYFGLLMTIFMWIDPGFSAALIHRRRPELSSKLDSAGKKIGGIPLITIAGVVWLCYIIPVFGLTVFYPILSALASTNIGALAYLGTSGVLLTVVVIIAGTAVYYLNRWWNRKRGIDLDMIFKSIPPG